MEVDFNPTDVNKYCTSGMSHHSLLELASVPINRACIMDFLDLVTTGLCPPGLRRLLVLDGGAEDDTESTMITSLHIVPANDNNSLNKYKLWLFYRIV